MYVKFHKLTTYCVMDLTPRDCNGDKFRIFLLQQKVLERTWIMKIGRAFASTILILLNEALGFLFGVKYV